MGNNWRDPRRSGWIVIRWLIDWDSVPHLGVDPPPGDAGGGAPVRHALQLRPAPRARSHLRLSRHNPGRNWNKENHGVVKYCQSPVQVQVWFMSFLPLRLNDSNLDLEISTYNSTGQTQPPVTNPILSHIIYISSVRTWKQWKPEKRCKSGKNWPKSTMIYHKL